MNESSSASAVDHGVCVELLEKLAHDLSSPLGVVSQAVAELRADFAAELTEEQRLLVALADRGLLRLGRIADSVELVATLESPEFALRTERTELSGLVRDAIETAALLEPRREVSITKALPLTPSVVEVDAERLSRAVIELIINAIRHARRECHVELSVDEEVVRIAVDDDGQGVAIDRIPTLFHRLHTGKARGGVGFGLWIAHGVVAAHGGSLAVEPGALPPGRPGTLGARFVATIPRTRSGGATP